MGSLTPTSAGGRISSSANAVSRSANPMIPIKPATSTKLTPDTTRRAQLRVSLAFERWCLIPVFMPSSSAPSCAVRATLDLRRSYLNAWGSIGSQREVERKSASISLELMGLRIRSVDESKLNRYSVVDWRRLRRACVAEAVHSSQLVRFETFEVDLRTGELRKAGVHLKLAGQPFQVLAILLEQPGEVVTREELQKRLWPDTFVDFDHNLNTAINKIREALGDSAERRRFVETLPRRGYRFMAPMEDPKPPIGLEQEASGNGRRAWSPRSWALRGSILFAAVVLLAGAVFFLHERRHAPRVIVQRALTRLSFEDGLQSGVTWSPDSRFIAYSSDRGGKSDIWVRQISGGDPVQITKGRGHNWQPNWSSDGKYIAYRSEQGDGGLFVVPALGGEGLQKRVATFGFHPSWSPDASRILFRTTQFLGVNKFYVTGLDGNQPREVLTDFTRPDKPLAAEAAWHPDGRISVSLDGTGAVPAFWTVPVTGGVAVQPEVPPWVERQLEGVPLEGIVEWTSEFTFAWAPSGRAVYFPLTLRGAVNLWKMTLDPETFRATAIERVTTGPGPDAELAVAPDGKKLAFTGQSQHIQAWLFPFDASRGTLTGPGQPVTPTGMSAWRQSLLADASDTGLFDWSPDGQSLLVTQVNKETNLGEIWLQPIAAAPNAQAAGRKIVSDPAYDLSQPHFSRDGRWIVFQALRNLPTKLESSLYVTSASGGPWIPLTDGQHWDDKPRWSPNGRMIYFISGRNGFFNVWGNRFDPVQGKPLGEAFQVTKFKGPALMIPQHIPSVELSVNQNQLVVTMEQVSGSIWMLENVD